MKIRYFDFGLWDGCELLTMYNILKTITDDFEIYGFEASKKLCESILKDNKLIIADKRVNILHLAIGSEHNKEIKLYHEPSGIGNSIYSSKGNVDSNKYEIVNSCVFSTFVEENNIDLSSSLNIIRLNIEGAEWDFFNDIIKTNIYKQIHIFAGDKAGADIKKVSELHPIYNTFMKQLEEHKIKIIYFCSDSAKAINPNNVSKLDNNYIQNMKTAILSVKKLI